MNVMSYILNFFGVLKRTGENCHLKRPADSCPVVQKLLELDIYQQMIALKRKTLLVKRIALVIIGLDFICAIIQAGNFLALEPQNAAVVKQCFVLLLIRTCLIFAVCGMLILTISTGERKGHDGRPDGK